MDKSERVKLHFVIIHKICGNLFAKPDPVENLRLGPDYISQISKFNRKRDDLFNSITSDLSKLEPEELTKNFSTDGTPIQEDMKTWAENYKREVDRSFGNLPIWYSAPLFRTKELADFKHWGRSEYLSIDEVVWLSVGLEPKSEFVEAIEPFGRYGSKTRFNDVTKYMNRHKEVIRRKFDPYNSHEKPDIPALLDWIDIVNLEVHPDFTDMLKKIAARKEASGANARRELQATEANAAPVRCDKRETASLARILTAMAIDAYGYVPGSKRGPIPKEIQGIAANLGMEISDETIRKFLRMGEQFIADDWEPPKP